MGCHTWFYVRVERTFLEAKELAAKNIEEHIALWSNADAYELDLIELDFGKGAMPWFINRLKKRLKKIHSPNYKVIWANQPEILYESINGQFYVESNAAHDHFRVKNYPPNVFLFSLNDVDLWLNNPINQKLYEAQPLTCIERELVDAWFKTFPESFITFG